MIARLGWVGAFVLACGLGVCNAQQARGPAKDAGIKLEATPALWKVKGAHGTVYLFGSVHVMRKDVHWETPKIKSAFASSDVLYLEIPEVDPSAAQAMQPMIMKLGMDPDHPLSTKIGKDDVALLDAAVRKLGLPGESALESMQPWLVYITLSVLPSVQAGYDPASGIDPAMLAEARAAKKTVKAFETAEQQVHFLADFPQAEQVALLHEALTDLPRNAGQMDEVVGDWTRGDVDRIASLDNDELKVKHPALYDKLLVQRNAHFADVLAGILKDPATGTVFVTVGAAHLAGPDSVQKMLEKHGFAATREQ